MRATNPLPKQVNILLRATVSLEPKSHASDNRSRKCCRGRWRCISPSLPRRTSTRSPPKCSPHNNRYKGHRLSLSLSQPPKDLREPRHTITMSSSSSATPFSRHISPYIRPCMNAEQISVNVFGGEAFGRRTNGTCDPDTRKIWSLCWIE